MFSISALMSTTAISANMNNVPMLNGTNFKDWKENILIVIGCMDIDLALRMPKSNDLTEESTPEEIGYFEKWNRSNRLSLMIMKRGIPEAFRGAITNDNITAIEFLSEIQNRFVKNDKAETSTLLASLISMKYKGKGNVREYIMEMSYLASKLKALKLDLSDDMLVHLILISLPTQFSQFKFSYNCQKEKWTLNELISFCVQEEERLKQDRTDSAYLASTLKARARGKIGEKKLMFLRVRGKRNKRLKMVFSFVASPDIKRRIVPNLPPDVKRKVHFMFWSVLKSINFSTKKHLVGRFWCYYSHFCFYAGLPALPNAN